MAATAVVAAAVRCMSWPCWVALLWVAFCVPALTSAETEAYIVHMDKSAMPSVFASQMSWYESTLAAAAPGADMFYVYDNAMHGFAARVTSEELEKLRGSRGFVSCYLDDARAVRRDTTHTPEFLGLSAAPGGLWEASEQGEDVIIGVVDTGSPSTVASSGLIFLGACDNATELARNRDNVVLCDATKSLRAAIFEVENAKVRAGLFLSNDSFRELSEHFTFPGVILSPQDGPALLQYLQRSRAPKASIKFGVTILNTKPAPVVATYSSRGPSGSCPTVLKPDVLAPGSLILASWAENVSVTNVGSQQLFARFNVISGTSMSCPHASGVAALLKAVHPEWSPAAVRSAMMTTASAVDNTDASIKDMGQDNQAATPLAMGSGHIDPNRAVDPGLVYDAGPNDYIKLMCAMNYTAEQIKTVAQSPSSAVDCTGASLDLNYPSFIAFFDPGFSSPAVRTFTRAVTNVGDAPASYSAKVKGLRGLTVSVVPDRLVFGSKHETKKYTVVIRGQMKNKPDEVLHGSLTWVDDAGKYTVRSPIVATTASSARL
ncbi:hypothetical protein ABZP36_013400 [Zizania latifolia]